MLLPKSHNRWRIRIHKVACVCDRSRVAGRDSLIIQYELTSRSCVLFIPDGGISCEHGLCRKMATHSHLMSKQYVPVHIKSTWQPEDSTSPEAASVGSTTWLSEFRRRAHPLAHVISRVGSLSRNVAERATTMQSIVSIYSVCLYTELTYSRTQLAEIVSSDHRILQNTYISACASTYEYLHLPGNENFAHHRIAVEGG